MAVVILAGLGGLVVGLLLVVAVAYAVIFRRPLPRSQGALTAAVRERVEITRDRDGVPHVKAESRADACFAVGFLHGQERLWQMELQRRIAAGRLSEVIGDRALPADRLMRRLGLLRVSQAEWHVTHAASELRPLLEAYAAGVNAAIADRPLPAEFTILRHRPEPWTPEDTLAVGRFLSFGQSGNWEAQLVRARLLKELGPEKMRAIEPRYDDAHPRLPVMAPAVGAAAGNLLDELEAAQEIVALSSWAEASNSWVLHGSRTASGKPILASDPHSVITMPSPWFQVHVATSEDEVAGLTFSGSPFVLVGHNRHIAWGLVNSGVSIQGLYVERFNPNNPLQFDDDGRWEDAVRFREVIRVRDGEPVVEDVLVTRRGPVIGPAIPGQHPPLTLRWTGHDAEVDSHGWVMRLNRAPELARVPCRGGLGGFAVAPGDVRRHRGKHRLPDVRVHPDPAAWPGPLPGPRLARRRRVARLRALRGDAGGPQPARRVRGGGQQPGRARRLPVPAGDRGQQRLPG